MDRKFLMKSMHFCKFESACDISKHAPGTILHLFTTAILTTITRRICYPLLSYADKEEKVLGIKERWEKALGEFVVYVIPVSPSIPLRVAWRR